MEIEKKNFTDTRLLDIFDTNVLPIVTLEVTEADWNNLLLAFDAAPGENFWIPGAYVFSGHPKIKDQRVSNITLRVRGNSSRNRPEGEPGELHNPKNPVWSQASFALRFNRPNRDQTFEGLGRLDLKFIREDPMRIRELYCFDLYQQYGIKTGPLMSFCRLYLKVIGNSATTGYFGIYKLKEFIEDDYLEARKSIFGDDKPGNKIPFLWKGDNGAALNNYNPAVIENQDIYDLRTNTNQRATANAQLTDFVRNLVNLHGAELENWANNAMDVELLFRTYLLNILCGNPDDYWSNANNYNFYFNTHGKFFFIPNDFDTTLGTGWGKDLGRQQPDHWGNPANPLIQKLLTIRNFEYLYARIFHGLVNTHTPFNLDQSIPRIQKWINMITPYLWDDTRHFGCHNEGAGCIIKPGPSGRPNHQTPFEDKPAWWVGDINAKYRLLDRDISHNFFGISGDYRRLRINEVYD